MAAITIKNMDVTYNKGKSYVIKDMNLEIKDGEFCVFLGPSGCGKSTAMYCIAGLLHPVHGEQRAFGQDHRRGQAGPRCPSGRGKSEDDVSQHMRMSTQRT